MKKQVMNENLRLKILLGYFISAFGCHPGGYNATEINRGTGISMGRINSLFAQGKKTFAQNKKA